MTIRIGVVGAGANTRLRHIPGFQAIEGVEVTAVCNRSLASSRKVADEFSIPQVFEDWRQLVADSDIDAICVGTWPNMHHDITCASIAAGKHLLTEARMAMNLIEAREMLGASRKASTVCMIVPAPFYLKYEQTVLDLMAAGEFGDLLEIHVRGMSGGYNPETPIHWRQQRELSGNNIMSMGILNETVRRYAGHEKSVLAHGKIFVPERMDPEAGKKQLVDVVDSIGIIAELESGATAVYHLSSVAQHGTSGAFEFYGSRGSLRYENGQALIALDGEKAFSPLQVTPEKAGGWRVEQDFIDAIRDGAPVTHTSFADGVKYMEFTDAVQISMKERRQVSLHELPSDTGV